METTTFNFPIDNFLTASCYQPNILSLGSSQYVEGCSEFFRPLFARTDGNYPNAPKEWLDMISKVYNSPRNIRGLDIGLLETKVQYYLPYPGGPKNRTEFTVNNMSSLRIATGKNCVPSLAFYENTFRVNALANIPVLWNTDIRVTGKAFTAFKRWSLANLEYLIIRLPLLLAYDSDYTCRRLLEILKMGSKVNWGNPDSLEWFSALCLLSKVSSSNCKGSDCIYPYPVNLINKSQSNEAIASAYLMNLIGRLINNGEPIHFNSDFSIKEFPRLKFIGFTLGDGEISNKLNLTGNSKANTVYQVALSGKVAWPAWFIATGAKPLSTALRLNSTFKFDSELSKFSEYFTKANASQTVKVPGVLKNHIKQAQQETKCDKSDNATYPLEVQLNSLSSGKASDLLLARQVTFGSKALDNEFNRFTAQGCQYYTALLNEALERCGKQ